MATREDISYWPYGGLYQKYKRTTWSRQKAPYVQPLGYDMDFLACENWNDTRPPSEGPFYVSAQTAAPDTNAYHASVARNKCYSSIVSAIAPIAQNANNLGEAKGNLQNIANHASTLFQAYKDLKKGNLPGALRHLGITAPPATRKRNWRKKQVADKWLELHFGWVPLVQDIGTSIDALCGSASAIQKSRVRGRGTAQFSLGVQNERSEDNEAIRYHTDYVHGIYGCRAGAVVSVANPNQFLANQMGFVNPLSVAWEAVPFSFVVDWFSNAGQVISSMTDFVGLNIEFAWTTEYANVTRDYSHSITAKHDYDSNKWWLNNNTHYTGKHVHVNRVPGITGPSFNVPPFQGFSVTRAATALSLLAQQMG